MKGPAAGQQDRETEAHRPVRTGGSGGQDRETDNYGPERTGGSAGQDGETDAHGGGEQNHQRPRETRVQIVVTWVSGLLLLAVVGYLVWEGTRPFTPAGFSAVIEEVRELEESYFVRLEVSNEGGQSVQGLAVVLELREGGEVVETAEGILDWLPESSSRELVLIVERDPRLFPPEVTFESYQIP